MFYALAWLLCSTGMRVFFGLRSHGRRNVPHAGGVILAVNHASYLDPVVVGCGVTRRVNFMARRTLFRGAFGRLIRALNAFPVERGEVDRGAVKEFLRRVSEGRVVMMFPEGTRTRDGRLGPLKPGIGALAVRAGAPVVPTYIRGTFEAWPRQRAWPRRAAISVRFGRPVEVERLPGETKRAQAERVREEIASRLSALEARALAGRP
jgi:1-acyl-sn-glycerol-3-phosphate acyltransferase